MKKLSTSHCPSIICKTTNIFKIKSKSYHHDKQMYKCKDCKTEWSEDTMYCEKCLDVVMYCSCYEDMY